MLVGHKEERELVNGPIDVKRTVLVVDDNPQIAKIVAIKLRLSGYSTLSASRGVEALELLRTQKPDLVLLDIFMPDMSGLEVIEKARTFTATPILAFTAREDIIKVAIEKGANGFVEKPFDPDQLIETIGAVLSTLSRPESGGGKAPTRELWS